MKFIREATRVYWMEIVEIFPLHKNALERLKNLRRFKLFQARISCTFEFIVCEKQDFFSANSYSYFLAIDIRQH